MGALSWLWLALYLGLRSGMCMHTNMWLLAIGV